jgi:site-specific DNA-methyltransferase (adenine-specific)
MPEDLVEPCILAGCPLGGVVLDPFAGTCTTGVVALRLGRDYIGIDGSPEYLRVGAERMGKGDLVTNREKG